MKKLISLSGLVFGLCNLGYSQIDSQASYQVTTPPVIDGKVDDWEYAWQTDEETKFQYNVCFDANNLYVRMKTSEEMTQAKIGRFGFTLWLNPDGKKKRKLGLKYPTPTGRDFSSMENPNQQMENKNLDEARMEMKRNLIKDTEVLELIGLAKENIVSSRLGLMNGIQVIIVMDETSAYVYEAKIPFKAYRLNKSSIPVLGVGFETGKMVLKGGGSGYNAPTYAGGGAPGVGAYGRMNQAGGGQRPTGNRQPYSTMQKATGFWVNVKLN